MTLDQFNVHGLYIQSVHLIHDLLKAYTIVSQLLFFKEV